MEFQQKLDELGDFWEKITFPNGVEVGPGRSKQLLWSEYFKHYFDTSMFEGKTILDIGCNAGGNIVELAKYNPAKIVGLDYSEKYLAQCRFVLDQFGIKADLRQFNVLRKTEHELAVELGKFDIIFCLGVIYHLNRDSNLALLRYMKKNSSLQVFSTQLFVSEQRTGIDWETTLEGTESLFAEAGFPELRTIHVKKDEETWKALTNQWYFETTS